MHTAAIQFVSYFLVQLFPTYLFTFYFICLGNQIVLAIQHYSKHFTTLNSFNQQHQEVSNFIPSNLQRRKLIPKEVENLVQDMEFLIDPTSLGLITIKLCCLSQIYTQVKLKKKTHPKTVKLTGLKNFLVGHTFFPQCCFLTPAVPTHTSFPRTLNGQHTIISYIQIVCHKKS